MKTALLSLVDDILAKRPVAPWRGGRGPQRPRVAGWAGVLLLLLAGFTDARAQVISNPNQITGTIRWNNPPGPVAAFLTAGGFNTASDNPNVPSTVTAKQVLGGLNQATRDFFPSTRISTPYEITVQGEDPTGIQYDVSPRMTLIGGSGYYFATKTSDGVLKEPEPDVVLDFEECAGLIRIHYRNSSGGLAPVDSSGIYAAIPANNNEPQASGGPEQNTGATDYTLVVRGGNTFGLFVSASTHVGTSAFLDYITFYTFSNYTVTVACDQIVDVYLIVPDPDIGTGTNGTLGRIIGVVDIVGEEEHGIPLTYTKMEAYNGPQGNRRCADVGLLTQPGYLPCPAPSPTAGTLSCNSAGPYSLVNLLPTTFQGLNQNYGVRAFQIFRQGHGFEQFVSPTLSGVTVPAGVTVDLGDTFVMRPGYVTGDIFLCGPDTTNSILRRLLRNSDNLDSQGLPQYLGFEYSSVYAGGLNDLGPGATFTAYTGAAHASFDGSFLTSGPDKNRWVGSYNLVLGGLGGPSGQTTYWDQRNLRLYLSSTPPVPTTDRDNYIYSSVYIQNHQFARQEIIPGQTITANHRYGGSCVIVDFRANSGTLFYPRVSGSGTFSGTFQALPANYNVDLQFAVGTPDEIGTATSDGQVVMYLPQGDYTLNPTVNSVNPNGGFTFNTLQPFSLKVPPCSKVRVTTCVQMTLSNSVPECATTNRLHVTGSVNSCTNITSISYVLNGAAPVTVCNNCGISATFEFDITLSHCANTLEIIATAANGDVSSVASTVRYDVTPPVLAGCTNISLNSLDGTNGNFVSYAVTALDNCDGVLPVTCVPPSGSFFAEGSTVVTCTARDHCGNTNSCQFTVEVRSEGCLRISNTNVVCLSNAPGSYRYSFTAQNLSPSAVKYLFVVPEPDCFTTSPSFFTFSPALQPGQSASVSLALNNLQPSCGDRLCFIFSLHTSNFIFCCAVTNCIPNPAFIEMHCPSNLTVSGPAVGAVVNYATPTVTGGVFAGCTPASGSVFSLGTTVVTCTATNACGSTNTCLFTVTVLNSTNCPCPVAATAPWPTNDTCECAISIPTGVTYGYTFNATPSPVGSFVPCKGSLDSPDVWYTFTAPCPGGMVSVDTCLDPCVDFPTSGNSAHFNTVLSVYTGTCLLLTQVACDDNNPSFCGTNYALSSRTSFKAKPLVPYLIRVSGQLGATGCFALNVAFAPDPPTPPKNDDCAKAIEILCNQPKAFNTCNATNVGPNDCPITKDVWYKYVPTCTGAVSVATCGSFFDTALAVYTGSCNNLNLVACNDNATTGPCAGSLQSRVIFDATTPGTTYYIRVGGANGASGFGNLSVVGPNPASGTCPTNSCSTVPKKRLYRVSGTSRNTPWSWCLSSPCCFNISGTVSNPPPVGAPASALVAAMVASINTACPGRVTATQHMFNAKSNPLSNAFEIRVFDCATCCVPNNSQKVPFVFRVGMEGIPCEDMCVVIPTSASIKIPTTGPCAFNPFIAEEPLSELDCNQNGEDDTIDILNGTSLDNDENGVPDECPIGLSIAYDLSGDETIISWAATDAILEQSASVTGPWSALPDATSPYVLPPTTGQKFYRLRLP